MTRVALITTGKCEHAALPLALERLFPGVTFEPLPPDAPLNGFTTTDVRNLSPKNAPAEAESSIRQLVATMVGAVVRGGIHKPFDIAVLLDDLELCNDSHPDRVVELVREAVTAHVRDSFLAPHRPEIFDRVKKACSFHLLRPMVEAYFFGDQDALTRAKCLRPPQFDTTRDYEQILITDPEYLGIGDDNDKFKPHRGGAGDRARHPKSYMTYLCDPSLTKKRPYRETYEGVDALKQLNWESVIPSAVTKCPFLSAMLDDLAWALELPLDWVKQEQTAELTRLKSDPNSVLRNI